MKTERTYTLTGDLVGKIWMPAVTCAKPVSYRFSRVPKTQRFVTLSECATLQEALDRVTNDGDFQSAVLVNAAVTVEDRKGSRLSRRTFALTGKVDRENACYYGAEADAIAASDCYFGGDSA